MATSSRVLRERQVTDKQTKSRDRPDAKAASHPTSSPSTFICFFCDARYTDKTALQRHQDCCPQRSVGLKSAFVRLPVKLENAEENVSVKHGHLANLGLVSTRKTGAPADRKCVSRDVIVIDDSDDEENGSKSGQNRQLGASVDSGDMGFKTPRSLHRLLNIDICSPLGHRLAQYLQLMPVGCDINNITNFDHACRTDQPVPDSETAQREASSRTDRHHQRREHPLPSFPVTFSLSRRCRQQFCHRYKFTHKQRTKFCRAVDTGLNTHSRRLARRMKFCCVALNRLQMSRDTVVRMLQYEDVCSTRGNCSHDACRARAKHSRPSDVHQLTSPSDSRASSSSCDGDAAERSTAAAAAEAKHPAAADNLKNCAVVLEDCRRCAPLSDAKSLPTPSFPLPDIDAVDVIAASMTTSAPNDVEPPEQVPSPGPSSAGNTPQCRLTMNDDLPPLTFHCDICWRVVDCSSDARSLIRQHFAAHAIADVELAYVTLPDGAQVIQLVQLQPTVAIAPSAGEAMPRTADVVDPRARLIRGILRSSSSRQDSEQLASRGAQQPDTDVSVPARKRVRWADDVSTGNLLDDDGRCSDNSEVRMQCSSDDQTSTVAAATSNTPPCCRSIPSYHYSPYPRHPPQRHRPTLPSDDVIISSESSIEFADDGYLHFQPLPSSPEVVQIDDSDEFTNFTDNNNCGFPCDNHQNVSSCDVIDLESRGLISSEECLGMLATLLQSPSPVSDNQTLFDTRPKVTVHHPAERPFQRSPYQVVPERVSSYGRSRQIPADIICID